MIRRSAPLALAALTLLAPVSAPAEDRATSSDAMEAAAEAMPGAEAADLSRPAQPREGAEAGPGDAVLVVGREVFLDVALPQCAVCHTLEDAGSAGEIGPNLDKLGPDAARVHAAVTQGVGVMPAYEGVLTAEQIDAVSVYVATATGADAVLE